jgi:integrase
MKPKEALERYDEWMQRERLAPLTRESYYGWVERFFAFRDSTGTNDVEERISNFLSSYSKHSEATQKQALNALAGKSGFYAAMGRPVGELPPWVNPKRPLNVPVWVTQNEGEAIMGHLTEPWRLMAGLMLGSGLRVGECVALRWRDFDFERLTVTIKRGKGNKDRITVLSRRLVDALKARMERCRGLWDEDRAKGRPGVALPATVARKCSSFGKEFPFFWVFPAAAESVDPESGITRRHHVHRKSLAKPLRVACRRAKIHKRVTAHAFRHGFATMYLLAGGNLRELQRLMGHANMETTEIYLHCLPVHTDRIGSPWDVSPRSEPEMPRNVVQIGRGAA